MIFENYLGIKQASALNQNMRALVISSVFVNALLVLVMWPQFSKLTLLAWFSVSSWSVLLKGRWILSLVVLGF